MSSVQIPTFEPLEITIGATVTWTRSLSAYPASGGWALTTYFRGAGKGVDVTGADAGSGQYTSEMTAEQSATLAAGRYDFQAWVSKGTGANRVAHQVGSGIVQVLPGFTDVATGTAVDGRSENEQRLANLRVAIDRASTSGTAEYQIAGRMKRRYSLTELLEMEARLINLVNAERLRAKVKKGGSLFQTVHSRFRR